MICMFVCVCLLARVLVSSCVYKAHIFIFCFDIKFVWFGLVWFISVFSFISPVWVWTTNLFIIAECSMFCLLFYNTMIAAPLGRSSYWFSYHHYFTLLIPFNVSFLYTYIRMSTHHARNAYWNGVSEMGEEEGRDRTCFAADMRFVFVNVYAELPNVRLCVHSIHLASTRRKWFCLHYGLKRSVKLAYSQHIIKYMIPLIGRLCILIAAANTLAHSRVEAKRIPQQQQAAWFARELILLLPSGLLFISENIMRTY